MVYFKAASALLCETSTLTLTPFLYPCLDTTWAVSSIAKARVRRPRCTSSSRISRRAQSTASATASATAPRTDSDSTVDVHKYDHLDPSPADYSSAPFTDACALRVTAGAGGHGCISFLREKYIANGPPNGGDGGTGGSVYIQAVQGETSLHKLARRSHLKAGRGKNGQGSLKGGARGEDLLITVPVGTVVREIRRHDPLDGEERAYDLHKRFAESAEDGEDAPEDAPDQGRYQRDKWLLYPGVMPKHFTSADLPPLPRPRRSNLVSMQPPAPLRLDLDKAMDTPMLLAAGAMGGLGNPHFVSKSVLKPKYATKGHDGVRIDLQLELKLLADVGLVGLPNAGKSTLLRALTKSRTRVGNWAFTTLSPNIGTLVLDDYTGRPRLDTRGRRKDPRTNVTIADIPGLIEGAHLDRGLGLGFLRHIERAAVLAFVLDLSARDAVEALKGLWKEVSEYENLREKQLNADTERTQPQEAGLEAAEAYKPFESSISPGFEPESELEEGSTTVLDPAAGRALPPLLLPPISSKPWFVIATKADLPETQENFGQLQAYLKRVQAGEEEHPSGKENAWRRAIRSVPVSAINKQGVAPIPEIIIGLLDG
ncbi:putative GTP-binding protein P8A3.11c, mitochondrial [Pseudocercospora fuligena]|uniref:Putative GTP-binding protein P8A3.11c, mitochondrial n=1 Tax=Pseudocercospora fuligena TaxID=685502 RepID=A0A8H6RHL9_9PEZI|nr:putative GTP-binding protein P8A3.11c, mitochondrial [Pseudocercospora fuligena]